MSASSNDSLCYECARGRPANCVMVRAGKEQCKERKGSQDSKPEGRLHPRYPDDVLFRFHWRDGKKHEGYGRDVADAFTRLGFGGGAARAELGDAQARLANIQQERKEIDNKLRQVRSEENEIRHKAAVFNDLQSQRVLGEEQRLEWVELLEEIRESVTTAPTDA